MKSPTQSPMQRHVLVFATVASLALAAAGCGVDQEVYNAAIKDRDAQKAQLAETKSALDKEQLAHKKDIDAREARVGMLTAKLTSLGQDVSRLETERTGLGGELDQAKKRMEELKLERQIAPLPPVILGGMLVVPQGLIAKMTGRPLQQGDLVRGLRDNILKLESAPPGEPRKKVRHLLPWLCVRHLHRRRCGPLPRPVKTSASTCNRSRACSMAMEVRRSMFMFLSLLSPPPSPSSLSTDSD